MAALPNAKNPKWLVRVLEGLRAVGYAIVEGVLDPSFVQLSRDAMYRVQEAILRDIGDERLWRAGERGVLRMMLRYDPHFYKFLEIAELLAVIDKTVSETAIRELKKKEIIMLKTTRLEQI